MRFAVWPWGPEPGAAVALSRTLYIVLDRARWFSPTKAVHSSTRCALQPRGSVSESDVAPSIGTTSAIHSWVALHLAARRSFGEVQGRAAPRVSATRSCCRVAAIPPGIGLVASVS